MPRKPYDPGALGAWSRTGPREYLVASYRSPSTRYHVDTAAGTCDCPAARPGATCKHVTDLLYVERLSRESLSTLYDTDLPLARSDAERALVLAALRLRAEEIAAHLFRTQGLDVTWPAIIRHYLPEIAADAAAPRELAAP